MGMIDKLIATNKARTMYNALCNRCKVRIMRSMQADVKQDTEAVESGNIDSGLKQKYANKTLELLCPVCKKRYQEMMSNEHNS